MNTPDTQHAIFAAGCFWGIESAFRKVEGVVHTEVGYTGGQTPDPSYKQVCTGKTGHAEAVGVMFDPAQVSYEDLLEVFWEVHDPTQVDRQGPDRGSQYRSAIFVDGAVQREKAQASKREQQEARDKPIATRIVDASVFYAAEDYHQQYLAKRGRDACASTILSG